MPTGLTVGPNTIQPFSDFYKCYLGEAEHNGFSIKMPLSWIYLNSHITMDKSKEEGLWVGGAGEGE